MQIHSAPPPPVRGANEVAEATRQLHRPPVAGTRRIPNNSGDLVRASPRRVEFQLALIGDWIDDPVTDAVRKMLPECVRWLSERAGVPEHLAERALSAAESQ